MNYKKIIRPTIELALVFAIIPITLTFLKNDTGNGLLMALLVLGNPLALLEINKSYSTLHSGIICVVLSVTAILLQMKFFLFVFIMEYFIFYTVMCLLGMRLGSIKRKIREVTVKPESLTE